MSKKLISIFMTCIMIISYCISTPFLTFATGSIEDYSEMILSNSFDIESEASAYKNSVYDSENGTIAIPTDVTVSAGWSNTVACTGIIDLKFDLMIPADVSNVNKSTVFYMKDAEDNNVELFYMTSSGGIRYGFGSNPWGTVMTLKKNEVYSFKIVVNTIESEYSVYVASAGTAFSDIPLIISDGRYSGSNPMSDGIKGIAFGGLISKVEGESFVGWYMDNVNVTRLPYAYEAVNNAQSDDKIEDVLSVYIENKLINATSDDLFYANREVMYAQLKSKILTSDAEVAEIIKSSNSLSIEEDNNRIYIMNEKFNNNDANWQGNHYASEGVLGFPSKGGGIAKNWPVDKAEKGEIYFEFDYKLNSGTNLKPDKYSSFGMRDSAWVNMAIEFFKITPDGDVIKGYGSDSDAALYSLIHDNWYTFKVVLNTSTGHYKVFIKLRDEKFSEDAILVSDDRYSDNPAKNGVRGITIYGFSSNNPSTDPDGFYLDNIKVYYSMPAIEGLTDSKGNEVILFDTEYVTVDFEASVSKLKASDFEFVSDKSVTVASKIVLDTSDDTVLYIYPSSKLVSASEYELVVKTGAVIGDITLPKALKHNFITTTDTIDISDAKFERLDKITFTGTLVNNTGETLNATVVMFTSENGVFTGLSFEDFNLASGETAPVELEATNSEKYQDACVVIMRSWKKRLPLSEKRFEY